MQWWEAIILGVVQGMTEWLPVSSSGHLAIARYGLGLEASTFYDLILHVATLLVVLWFYRIRVATIIVAFLAWPRNITRYGIRRGSWRDPDLRLAWLVLIASIPIGLAGYFGESYVEAAFTSINVVGVSLIGTGVILHFSQFPRQDRLAEPTRRGAFMVGLAQVLALLPGISRSGTTIAAGLHAGLTRKDAADFAFLMAIPALVGATLFKASAAEAADWQDGSLWIGFAASLVVGYITLKRFVAYVAQNGIHRFRWYCFIIGAAILIGRAYPHVAGRIPTL